MGTLRVLPVMAAIGILALLVNPVCAKDELIVYSWWTAGGEADGLNALFSIFQEKYPQVSIINTTVAGGAGTNSKAVLKTRMLGGNPPDTFLVHAGSELIDTWVKTGFVEPITELWEKNGWYEVIPKALVDMVSYQGEIYAVPSDVHRGNLLWYNKKIFAQHNLQPPTTFDEFFAAADALSRKGITPLALASKNRWPLTHLFETVIVGVGGPDFYRDLFAGRIAWTDQKVKEALTILGSMLRYANTDHPALTWDQACARVVTGEAAMTIMGDWAKGYFTTIGAEPEVDYDIVPAPNNDGVFIAVTDTFVLAKNAPNRENGLRWLEVVGSLEGQNSFNPRKGSIPVRADSPHSIYDPLAVRTMEAFLRDAVVPSAAHSSAVSDAFVSAINDELGAFAVKQNVTYTAARLEQHARELGVR